MDESLARMLRERNASSFLVERPEKIDWKTMM
jgi:hypothetical protein